MTYALFLLLFVALPAALSAFLLRRTLDRRAALPFALLLIVVYAATSPWDNVAVAQGLWSFDPERTWSLRLGWLPIEEYLFFGLQTLLTGVWVWHRLSRVDAQRGAA